MQVIYAGETFPSEVTSSLFLAGPSPRIASVPSWRPAALALLEEIGYNGVVYVPEPRNEVWPDYTDQIEWEDAALTRVDCIVFWIPRDMSPDEEGRPKMAGLTTNHEFGFWVDSGKVLLGAPEDAFHVKYQQYYARKYGVPVFNSLEKLLAEAVRRVTPGAYRMAEECLIPLHIWSLPSFQDWFFALIQAGSRLEKAKVLWVYPLNGGTPFLWGLEASVRIAGENRVSNTEMVVGRPDIATMILWKRAPALRDIEVLIVREFRTAGRVFGGYLRGLPGGSSTEEVDLLGPNLLQVAINELSEETGITVSPTDVIPVGHRQVIGSLSSVCASVFAIEVSDATMKEIRSKEGSVYGLVDEDERTFPEIWTVGKLLDHPVTDWSTLGMIFAALSKMMPNYFLMPQFLGVSASV